MKDDFGDRRQRLVSHLRERGITDEVVLNAIGRVPRERFVSPALEKEAYSDNALPADCGQTISQPFIVAMMTQLLELQDDERVLEIGTGTGYQTAVLAQLCNQVITIERHAELSNAARRRIARLEYSNVTFFIGDGTLGAPTHAPFDRILVTAGAPEIPRPLYDQLVDHGRMVIPIGDEDSQQLCMVKRTHDGPQVTDMGGCRFVKLVGDAGWSFEQNN